MRFCFAGLIWLLVPLLANAQQNCNSPWPLWEKFAGTHIQADGRVVDYGAENISTSEGQSYALFFSLVADDRNRFDRILKWTSDNLSQGDLGKNLPAWKWGQDSGGAWRVLDMNPASDADLWIAYSLYHAAAIWKQPRYLDTASRLLKNISEREVVDLPKLGSMLLPAPYGFALNTDTWRLNPSYLPIQLLRYFSTVDRQGPWKEITLNTFRLISATSNKGLVPDWVLYGTPQGFRPDPERGNDSSYDSIRVYLWWAMLNQHDPLFDALRPYVTGATYFIPGNSLPERIHVSDGTAKGKAPSGFTAALAPYRFVLYHHQTHASLNGKAGYYDYVLSLFGYGWLDGRFRFNPDGSLQTASSTCSR
ncbi:MAG TPA: cellulose synthase complex periplasmic endoglucanase BcsZ [Gallionella sp.]|nr:cellulose synthase complex periplasmic endoglucanase BcsZ [Gallionella sp.]